MPRLRDSRTGVVVNVDDDTARALGAAYEPASQPTDEKKAPAKRPSSSKSSK